MSGFETPFASEGFTADRNALERRAADLVQAMARALESLPEPAAVRAVGRCLSIDKTLAWKATRIAAASDLAGVLSALPGQSGRRKLLEALATVTDAAEIDGLRAAFHALDEEIATRCLNKATLAAMAAGGLDSESQRHERRRVRESAWDAAARVFGTTARLVVQSNVFLKTADTGTVEHHRLSTIRGLHRTGPGPRLVVEHGGRLRDGWSSRNAAAELIQPAASGEILFQGDGTSSCRRIDLAFTDRSTWTTARESARPTLAMLIRVPSERAVLEILVDRGLDWPPPSDVATVAQPLGVAAPHHAESTRLPMSESLETDVPFELDESFADDRDPQAVLVDRLLAELGRTREDVVVHRLVTPWPIFGSRLDLIDRQRPAPAGGETHA